MKYLLLLALVGGCCNWSRTDTILEATAQASIAADWYTTERALSLGAVETNPILGESGDRIPRAVYFPLTGLLHAGISMALPPKYRTAFQGFTIGLQSKAIFQNVWTISVLEDRAN